MLTTVSMGRPIFPATAIAISISVGAYQGFGDTSPFIRILMPMMSQIQSIVRGVRRGPRVCTSSQLPGLRKMDFTLQTDSTLLYRKDYGGEFLYWDNQYHDSYTNNGNLLGSWIGRDARAYSATATYWLSAKSKLQGQYRQIKPGADSCRAAALRLTDL